MIIKRLLTHRNLQVAALVYTLLITVLSLWRFIAFDPIPVKNGDKIAHCLAYFGFAVVWFGFYFFSEKKAHPYNPSLRKSALIAFFWGALMEMAQGLLTTYRMFDYYDLLANTSGVVLATILLYLSKKELQLLKTK